MYNHTFRVLLLCLLLIFQIHKLLHGWGARHVLTHCVCLVYEWTTAIMNCVYILVWRAIPYFLPMETQWRRDNCHGRQEVGNSTRLYKSQNAHNSWLHKPIQQQPNILLQQCIQLHNFVHTCKPVTGAEQQRKLRDVELFNSITTSTDCHLMHYGWLTVILWVQPHMMIGYMHDSLNHSLPFTVCMTLTFFLCRKSAPKVSHSSCTRLWWP